MPRDISNVLRSAKQVLENALQGEADYLASADRRTSGLYNAVSSGRSVTFVLQNLRSVVKNFDAWYAPVQDNLRADPVAKYFVELRNRIEKEGDPGQARTSVRIRRLSADELRSNTPPGAINTFLGDEMGRSGWDVKLPDGSITKVFFTLPAHIGSVALSLEGAPGDRNLDELLREWLAKTESVYLAAVDEFAPDPAPLRELRRPNSGPFDDATKALLRAATIEARSWRQ
ncbi:hypothetical protein ACFUPZ_05605 [Microbacterium oxydans]|uniref:hypothetical protein n=1 Tax=Microbacterium oxydans TaxID=82380 RepID=UPI0036455EF8